MNESLSEVNEVEVTTRIPEPMYAHLESIAEREFGTLHQMQVVILDRFLDEEPWREHKSRCLWFETHPIQAFLPDGVGVDPTEPTKWVGVGLSLPARTVDRLKALADERATSVSFVLHAAIQWGAWYAYPPSRDPIAGKLDGNRPGTR